MGQWFWRQNKPTNNIIIWLNHVLQAPSSRDTVKRVLEVMMLRNKMLLRIDSIQPY